MHYQNVTKIGDNETQETPLHIPPTMLTPVAETSQSQLKLRRNLSSVQTPLLCLIGCASITDPSALSPLAPIKLHVTYRLA